MAKTLSNLRTFTSHISMCGVIRVSSLAGKFLIPSKRRRMQRTLPNFLHPDLRRAADLTIAEQHGNRPDHGHDKADRIALTAPSKHATDEPPMLLLQYPRGLSRSFLQDLRSSAIVVV